LLKSGQRPALQRFLTEWLVLIAALPESKKVRWAIDVDPQEMGRC
jgi:primosomal protein N' (replication factor Y)